MTAVAPRKASRREWIGLAVIALPCLLYSMDVTVLNLAVPHISADLRPSSETSSELGGALGIAVLGSIGVAVYRSMMADGVPIDVPPEPAGRSPKPSSSPPRSAPRSRWPWRWRR